MWFVSSELRKVLGCEAWRNLVYIFQLAPICTDQDKHVRNDIHDISYWLDVTCIIGTVVAYLGTICASRRTLRFTCDTNSLQDNDIFIIIPNETLFMLKYAKVQRRIYRVVIVIAASFLCTSFVTLILAQTLVQRMDITTSDSSTPYIFIFVLFNSADTVLITAWRDKTFRKRLKEALFSMGNTVLQHCRLSFLHNFCADQKCLSEECLPQPNILITHF